MKKLLFKILFGTPIKGEPASKPLGFTTSFPPNIPLNEEWLKCHPLLEKYFTPTTTILQNGNE